MNVLTTAQILKQFDNLDYNNPEQIVEFFKTHHHKLRALIVRKAFPKAPEPTFTDESTVVDPFDLDTQRFTGEISDNF